MQVFLNADGKLILMKMVEDIQKHKAYLSDIDGLIGDGDHGANMNKGFTVFERRFGGTAFSFSEGLSELSMILMNEIGGSMGPIYGTIFMQMSDVIDELEKDDLCLADFANCLNAALAGLYEIVDARVGDKTLVDTLAPSVDALNAAAEEQQTFSDALERMKKAAEAGRDSTKDLVARFGRSSRLGERSRGVLDAGACSCCILLTAMANGILELL